MTGSGFYGIQDAGHLGSLDIGSCHLEVNSFSKTDQTWDDQSCQTGKSGGTQEKDHGITGNLSGGTGITDTGDTHDDGTEDQREDHHIQCIHIDASQKTGDGQYRFKSSSQKKSGQNTENQADKDCTCDMFLIPRIKLFIDFLL